MRRNATLAVGLVAVVGASAVGWTAGRQIRSPAEIAARTAPPTPSLIAVPVEKRQLSSDVVVRGNVRYGVPQVVSLPTSALKPAKAIVTSAPVKGSGLNEGAAALVLSGRPVFVLQGAQPAYRDLGPGTVGADVRQLEEAVARLGFDPGPIDGVYDAATGLAVESWYRAAGWTPMGPTDEQLQARRTAEGDQFAAESDLRGAEESLAIARAAQAAAEDQAQIARAAVEGAPAAEAAAQAKTVQERRAADADIATRTAAVDAAGEANRVARLQRDEARAADPPPTPAALAALDAALHDAAGAVKVASAELAAAQAAGAAVDVVPPASVTASLNRAAATADAELARTADAVRLAQDRLALLADRHVATRDVVHAMDAKLGIQVPADEVVFVSSLPQRIDDATAKAGSEVSGPVMTVSNFQLAVDAALSLDDAKLMRTGASVTIEAPDLAIHAAGTVTQIADTPGTKGVDPQRFYLEVTPTDAPAGLLGASVVLTITADSTAGEVLAVPVAALSVAADGTARVQVQEPNGATHDVTVTAGLSAKGLVAVAPAGPLSPGDLVVVGATPTDTTRTTIAP